VDTKDDNQDIQMLREDLWLWRTTTEIPIALLRTRYFEVNRGELKEHIKKLQTREKEMIKELEKKNRQI